MQHRTFSLTILVLVISSMGVIGSVTTAHGDYYTGYYNGKYKADKDYPNTYDDTCPYAGLYSGDYYTSYCNGYLAGYDGEWANLVSAHTHFD
jgi:hypothetical protein